MWEYLRANQEQKGYCRGNGEMVCWIPGGSGEGTAGPLLCFQTSVVEPGERGHYKARNQKKESQKEVRRGKNRAEKMWN